METFSALLALCAGNSPVPVNSPHKGQWRGALMFTLICARINDWVNNREAGDLKRHLDHYDVSVMIYILHPMGYTTLIRYNRMKLNVLLRTFISISKMYLVRNYKHIKGQIWRSLRLVLWKPVWTVQMPWTWRKWTRQNHTFSCQTPPAVGEDRALIAFTRCIGDRHRHTKLLNSAYQILTIQVMI